MAASPSAAVWFFAPLLLLLLLLHATEAAEDEAAALLAFRRASVSDDPRGALSGWSVSSNANANVTSAAPCSWDGVSCSGGRVASLNLSGMALSGELRLDSLLSLPALQRLDLRGNAFYGNLSRSSTTASSCALLELLDLSSNALNGTLPASFLSPCAALRSLNLSRNALAGGGFPFATSSLRSLDLSRNRLDDPGLLNYSFAGCHGLRHLNLSANQLAGRLPSLAPCNAEVAVLDVSWNRLSGALPPGLVSGAPATLTHLSIAGNNFTGDDVSAYDFGGCANLTALDWSFAGLSANQLPPSLAGCARLETLDMSGNRLLGGQLPAFLAGFSSLRRLALAGNDFSGSIPEELGRGLCGRLVELDLSSNRLEGGLPESFAGCASLEVLHLGGNQLSGSFVDTVVSTISSLRVLGLSFNNITGRNPLPALAAGCPSLEVIDLGSNELVGEVMEDLCSSLPRLRKLYLPSNYLNGTVPRSLGNCASLEAIDLSFNFLVGEIPREIIALPRLTDLVMWANGLSGEIPDTLCPDGNGSSTLETLVIGYNNFTGGIPPSVVRCVNLLWLSLSGNGLTGTVPPGFGRLQKLAILQLNKNRLTGPVPAELGSCSNLIWLDLNSNGFTGAIPPELASQTGLIPGGIVAGKQFAFLRNEAGNICPGAGVLFEFFGIRPERLAAFPTGCASTRIYLGTMDYKFVSNGSIIFLDLSYNGLTGAIPPGLGSMMFLEVMNLGHNQLNGTIPHEFSGLRLVGALDLSNNHLTGGIPPGLGTLSFLADLDVSNNNLSGPIPSTGQLTTFPQSRYANNTGLCGIPLPPCGHDQGDVPSASSSDGNRRRKAVGESILVGIALSMLILLLLAVTLCRLRKNQKAQETRTGYIESLPTTGTSSWKLSGVDEPLSINVATFEKPLRKLTFAHLLEATNGFSAETLIGSGGFGEVYKAKLKDGAVVAIKKLIHFTGQGDREFTAEMETIGKIKHRNLVPLLGYCKIGDERLLVYEYMKHGSLDVVLHDKQAKQAAGAKLDWAARKKIAIGSARGLAFLHHSCIPHIIHRDMKSSNVLLDSNLDARVSDFGMARLMNALDTHLSVSTLAGTPGYVPPEYYQSFRCTTKGDVYSYGVVLLELLSGKKPIDPTEFGDNNLVGWVKQMVKENRSSEIFDPTLTNTKSGEAELYQYLKIARECLDDRPNQRPTMIQVMAMFKELQLDSDSDFLDGFSINSSTIDESAEKST